MALDVITSIGLMCAKLLPRACMGARGRGWCGKAEGFLWDKRKSRREMSLESTYPELFLCSFFHFNTNITGLTEICVRVVAQSRRLDFQVCRMKSALQQYVRIPVADQNLVALRMVVVSPCFIVPAL